SRARPARLSTRDMPGANAPMEIHLRAKMSETSPHVERESRRKAGYSVGVLHPPGGPRVRSTLLRLRPRARPLLRPHRRRRADGLQDATPRRGLGVRLAAGREPQPAD